MTLHDLAFIAWTWFAIELLDFTYLSFKHADLMPVIDTWMIAP